MDLLTLNKTTFTVEGSEPVQDYNTLIWTERYQEPSSFEVTTSLIEETRAQLPVGSLVTLRDSLEVMMVETHQITESPDSGDVLTVQGRSLTAFLENRVATFLESRMGLVLPLQFTAVEASAYYIWSYLVNTSTYSIVGKWPPPNGGFTWETNNSPLNAVPNLMVSESMPAQKAASWWLAETGDLSTIVLGMLHQDVSGIRAIRPNSSGGSELTFSLPSDAGPVATVTKTAVSNTNKVRLDLFSGVDRSINQSALPQIVFHTEIGDLEDTTFLYSIKDHRNVAYAYAKFGEFGNTKTVNSPDGATVSGLDRRVILVDGGSREPEVAEVDVVSSLHQKAFLDLSQKKLAFMFDGSITDSSSQGYTSDYNLGDTVTIMGKYGISESMLVSEYIRTEDAFGEHGYPTLAQL